MKIGGRPHIQVIIRFPVDLVKRHRNEPPTIQFVCGPPEGKPTVYQVHMYWMEHDPNGKVAGCEKAEA